MTSPPSATAQGSDFWELDAELSPDSEELWSLFCFDRGATGAQVLQETRHSLRQRYFFPGIAPAATGWLAAFAEAYPGAQPPRILRIGQGQLEDWQTNWRRHFRPLPVGERLLICPPWDVPAPAARAHRLPVIINPGQGFGTGYHASTYLALLLLERVLTRQAPPAAMVDVGTGSGILAIAAARLGVRTLWTLDIDGRALPDVADNWRANGLAGHPHRIQAGPGCLGGHYPLVVANMVAPVLLAEREALQALLSPGGQLILSGVLEAQRGLVAPAFAGPAWHMADQGFHEGWWGCTITRR